MSSMSVETMKAVELRNERAEQARRDRETGHPRYWAMIDAAISRARGVMPAARPRLVAVRWGRYGD